MAAIYKGTLGLIGNTPLVEPMNLEKELGLEAAGQERRTWNTIRY